MHLLHGCVSVRLRLKQRQAIRSSLICLRLRLRPHPHAVIIVALPLSALDLSVRIVYRYGCCCITVWPYKHGILLLSIFSVSSRYTFIFHLYSTRQCRDYSYRDYRDQSGARWPSGQSVGLRSTSPEREVLGSIPGRNFVLQIIMSCSSANSSSRSPRSFLSPYPKLPMTLSHPLLSLPIFAFQSPAMITIAFFDMSSSVVSRSAQNCSTCFFVPFHVGAYT